MIKTRENLYIVDTRALAFRCYYAYPDSVNSEGKKNGIVKGVKNFIEHIIGTGDCDYLAFANESGTNFRNEIYPEYKAGRKEKEEDLLDQLHDLNKFLNLLNLGPYMCPGYEADDVIGALCKKYKKVYNCTIVSPDKDFMQLVDKDVTLLRTHKFPVMEKVDIDGVVKKLGVRPDQVVDYLSIVGDSSDNIPGVKGIGAKGAEKLLKTYETLEGIYNSLPAIASDKKSTGDKLQKSHDNAILSKKLAQIATDFELPEHLSPVWVHDLQNNSLKKQEVINFLNDGY